MRPFCHLLIKAVRVDSPPLEFDGKPLSKALEERRLQRGISQKTLANELGVSRRTFQNWETGRTKPAKGFWPRIRTLFLTNSE